MKATLKRGAQRCKGPRTVPNLRKICPKSPGICLFDFNGFCEEMVPQEGTYLNHLFQELADWEEQLKGLDEEIPRTQPDTMEGPEL